jgi:hypothetical protein
MKILVIEPNMQNSSHSAINAGFLAVFKEFFHSPIVFFAAASHLKFVNNDNVEKRSIFNFSYSPKYFIFNEIIYFLRHLRFLLLSTKYDYIIYLGSWPIGIIIISYLNRLPQLQRNIIICMHGQLEAYLPKSKIGFSKYYYLINRFIFKSNDRVRYIILGDPIRKASAFLFDSNKVISMDQPFIFNNEMSKKKISLAKIKVGLIGRFNESKNANAFFVLLNLLNKNTFDRFEIFIIGKIEIDIPSKILNNIKIIPGNLPKEAFNDLLKSLDYSLSVLDSNYYRATASGAVFESIQFNLPILGLNNPFLSYYFEKSGGIGYLFRDLHEFADFLNTFDIEKESIAYHNFQLNLQKLKEMLSVKALAKQFAKQV